MAEQKEQLALLDKLNAYLQQVGHQPELEAGIETWRSRSGCRRRLRTVRYLEGTAATRLDMATATSDEDA
ncbi:MAG: hypothetical protein WKF37_01580 [Bryobacteraceae bacterium]